MEKRCTEIQKAAHKERLKNNISIKFQTTIFSAISQIEIAYGYIWGMGLPYESLDEEQKAARIIWDSVRQKILDSGHQQRRNALSEIQNHEVVFNGYVTEFIINGNRKD